jgi:PST family polysaccharide transporter
MAHPTSSARSPEPSVPELSAPDLSVPDPAIPDPSVNGERDRHLATDHLTADLGRRSRRGGAVLLAAQGVRVLGQVATLVVLARLLPPSAFGLLAMVASLGAILDLVKEFGLSSATIQKRDITQAQVSTLFWINGGVGLLLGAALFAGAPLLAAFYHQPELTDVARCLSLAFVASGVTVQHWALLRRQMRFGAIAAVETGADIVGFAAALGVAFAGGDYWALVAQRLAYVATGLAASWSLCRWRPGPPRAAPDLRRMVAFGGSVTGCYFAVVLTRSLDLMLIGWLWGPAVLGAYERATKLLMLPLNSINGPVYAVGMPALSRLVEHDRRYRARFGQMIQKLAMLTMPAFALMAATADWMVQIVFGTQWSATAPIAMWFCIAGASRPVVIAVGRA